MARVLIVDGHSVIFAWPELRSLHQKAREMARDALISRLTAYQDGTQVRVVAVFDGKGSKPSDERVPGGIQIFYSSSSQTADDIVERLVARYASEHEITVATDDGLEQQTVTTFGAVAISTDLLRLMLEDTDAQVRSEIEKRRRRL